MTSQGMRPRWAIAIASFVGVFGVLSIKSGAEVLFFDGPGREAAGNYVPFVVWFNFLAGFAYMVGALGLALWRSWVTQLAFSIAILTLVVFMAFGVHITNEGAYEMRTVAAMVLRSLVWLGIAFSLRAKFTQHNAGN
jgi:hypothetical protein